MAKATKTTTIKKKAQGTPTTPRAVNLKVDVVAQVQVGKSLRRYVMASRGTTKYVLLTILPVYNTKVVLVKGVIEYEYRSMRSLYNHYFDKDGYVERRGGSYLVEDGKRTMPVGKLSRGHAEAYKLLQGVYKKVKWESKTLHVVNKRIVVPENPEQYL